MNYRIEKALAFLFLLVVLLLTWYLFLIDDFVTESEERITKELSIIDQGLICNLPLSASLNANPGLTETGYLSNFMGIVG